MGLPAGTMLGFSVARHLWREHRLLRQDQSMLLSFLCQSLWSRHQLRRAGYQVQTTCICGGPSDCISRRLPHCPCASHLREQMLTEADRVILSDRHRNFPLACGFAELPSPVASPPQGSGTTPFQFWCDDPESSIEQAFSGDVVTDGSCFKDGPCAFHSAGRALVKLTPVGELFAATWGAVGPASP